MGGGVEMDREVGRWTVGKRAGGWKVGGESGLLQLNWKTHTNQSHFSETLIPYSRFSRIDQTDLEHLPARDFLFLTIFEVILFRCIALLKMNLYFA